MTIEQIILTAFGTALTIALVPICVSAFARIRKLEQQAASTNEFNTFLKTYLLREAVLTFHSNPNSETDKIIEKIGRGGRPTAAEYHKLEEKIRKVAETAEQQKARLKAESALELLQWAFADEINTSTELSVKARNQLFNE